MASAIATVAHGSSAVLEGLETRQSHRGESESMRIITCAAVLNNVLPYQDSGVFIQGSSSVISRHK